MEFPELTQIQAKEQKLKAFKSVRKCADCGDYRRFLFHGGWVCWTCYDGESSITTKTVGIGTLNRTISKHNTKVVKAKRQLTGIPRVFGSYNTHQR